MDDHYIINMQDLVFVIPHHSVSIKSLNGSIFNQPLAFADSKNLDIEDIKN